MSDQESTEFQTELHGTVYACPDFTDAYDILPKEHWVGGADIGNLDGEKLREHAMSGLDPDFAAKAIAGEFGIIVAGKQFGGGGKSIEHPIVAIRAAGIDVVIAESFSRYFYRNAINNGLPVLQVPGISEFANTGDELLVELDSGTVVNKGTGEKLEGERLPEIAMDILRSGGGINFAKRRLQGAGQT